MHARITSIHDFDPFVHQWAVRLTTYRRNGTPVGTAVSIAVEGDHAFFRTPDKAGKAKRLRHNSTVEIAPSTWLGKPSGPALRARAQLLGGEEAEHAARLLARKYPVLQGIFVPLTHRLMRFKTLHYKLMPVDN